MSISKPSPPPWRVLSFDEVADRLWKHVQPAFHELLRKLDAELIRIIEEGYLGEVKLSIWSEDSEEPGKITFKGAVYPPGKLPETGKHAVLYWNQRLFVDRDCRDRLARRA